MREIKIFSAPDLHKEMQKSLTTVESIVGGTLGYNGRLVINSYPEGGVSSSKDGHNILTSLAFSDPIDRMIAKVLIDAAKNTLSGVGDGTTTSVVLTKAVYDELLNVKEGRNVYDLMLGAKEAVRDVEELLKRDRIFPTRETLIELATVSANNNEFLGNLVGNMVHKIGIGGATYVKTGTKTEYKIEKGYSLDSGVMKYDFYNMGQSMVFEGCYAILVNEQMSKFETHVAPILKQYFEVCKKNPAPLVFFTPHMDGDALSTLLLNNQKMKQQNGFSAFGVVRMPFEGFELNAIYEDLQAIFNCKRILSTTKGNSIQSIANSDFGWIKKISAFDKSTKITLGEFDVSKRIEDAELKDDDFNRRRVSYFTTGIGTLYIGSDTNVSASSLFDSADDSLKAALSAMEFGMLPGGGKALYHAKQVLKEQIAGKKMDDAMTGYNAVLDALSAPIERLLRSSLSDEKEVQEVFTKLSGSDFWISFNQRTKKVEDVSATILDAAMSPIIALQSAVSVAGELITANHLIV